MQAIKLRQVLLKAWGTVFLLASVFLQAAPNNPNTDWFQQIPADKYTVKLYKSDNHQRNFIECVKSRKPTIAPIEVAHHSAIPGHLGLISMLVGRKIKWDVAKEIIVGDPEASKLLTRPYRQPWKMV